MKIRGFLELSLLLPPLVNKDTKRTKKRHGYCYVIRREIDVTSDLNNRVGSIVSVWSKSHFKTSALPRAKVSLESSIDLHEIKQRFTPNALMANTNNSKLLGS